MSSKKLSPREILLSTVKNKTILHYAPGATILMQGDECSELFFILKGSVRAVLLTRQNEELIVSIHGTDEFICEASYAKYGHAMVSLYAVEDTELLAVRDQDYYEIIVHYPELSTVLMANMAQKLDMMVNGLDQYASSSIRERIESTLLLFAGKYGVETPWGLRIDRKITDTEIGNYVGAKRETVNRLLRKMRDEEIVQKIDGYLYIQDKKRLENSLAETRQEKTEKRPL